jgi:hypothetical protein
MPESKSLLKHELHLSRKLLKGFGDLSTIEQINYVGRIYLVVYRNYLPDAYSCNLLCFYLLFTKEPFNPQIVKELLGYGNDPAFVTEFDHFLDKIMEKPIFWSQGAYGIDILGELGVSFDSKNRGRPCALLYFFS